MKMYRMLPIILFTNLVVINQLIIQAQYFGYIIYYFRYKESYGFRLIHDDNGDALIIVLRFITSLFGCISIIGLFIGIYSSGNKLLQLVHWSGVYSLEIYLTHYLVLNMIQMTVTPQFGTLEGMRLLAVNYLLTIGMVCLIIKILQRNNILNYLLYAKRTLSNF